MSRSLLLRVTATVAVAGGLGLAQAAHGASVSAVFVPPSNCFKANCMEPGGTFATFAADPGEPNRLTIVKVGTASVFTEAALQVRAGSLCVQGTATSASCAGSVSVKTADGDDQVQDTSGASVDGGDGNDLLRGTGQLAGGSGNDRIEGGGSPFTYLSGGPGSDTLTGTPRRDAFVDADAGEPDTYDGGAGSDSLSYAGRATPVRVTLGAGGTEDTMNSIESVGGGNGNDKLTGDPGPNEIVGGKGRDVIAGGAGADVLGGARSPGNAIRFLGAGFPTPPAGDPQGYPPRDDKGDEIDAGPGRDVVEGAGGPDRLTGGDGDDEISGAGGRDIVKGGAGADTLEAGVGAGLLDGGTGKDRLDSEGGGNRLLGGPGNDTITIADVVKKTLDRIRCGSGRDTVQTTDVAPLRGLSIPRDCEVTAYGSEFRLIGAPRRAGRSVRIRVRRGSEPDRTDRIRLRSGRKLLGVTRRITRSATYRVKLNRTGRRLARRGRTVTVARRAVKKAYRDPDAEQALRYRLR